MEIKDNECCRENFLYSNVEAWQLYSPQRRGSKCLSVFYIVWLWAWSLIFSSFLIISGAQEQSWYTDESQRVKWFIYLTNWGYLVFCMSLLVRAITATYCYFKKVTQVTWYLKLNWTLYELSSSAAILITLLFWGLLYSPDQSTETDTPVTHGVNAVFVFIDIWITAMPIRVLHFYVPMLFGVVYGIFSLIYDFSGATNALGSGYIYKVLDWNGYATSAPIYAVSSVLAVGIIHCGLFGHTKLRMILYQKCEPRSTKSFAARIIDSSASKNDIAVASLYKQGKVEITEQELHA